MTCAKCKGRMQADRTTFVADMGACCVVIRNVPCSRCEICGEIVYSLEVMERLEELVELVQKAVAAVTVLEYTEAA